MIMILLRFWQVAPRAFLVVLIASLLSARVLPAADRVNMIYTARVMSQAYPWIAQEAGLFKKYDLDVPMVFVTPGAPSVAAILSGDSEVAVIGAASITRPWVQGNKDPSFVGGIKSLLTHRPHPRRRRNRPRRRFHDVPGQHRHAHFQDVRRPSARVERSARTGRERGLVRPRCQVWRYLRRLGN
jgi:hypothetical protein